MGVEAQFMNIVELVMNNITRRKPRPSGANLSNVQPWKTHNTHTHTHTPGSSWVLPLSSNAEEEPEELGCNLWRSFSTCSVMLHCCDSSQFSSDILRESIVAIKSPVTQNRETCGSHLQNNENGTFN